MTDRTPEERAADPRPIEPGRDPDRPPRRGAGSPRRRLLLGLGMAFVVLAFALVLVVGTWLSRGRAQRSGEAALPGLEAPVTVRWDERGVPYVDADTTEDLAAAQGWLHANDRLTQMELGRRLAAGRLSELAGPRALPLDREVRTLRLGETAAALWDASGAETRAWLAAYARGVNAWIEARGDDLPPDLVLVAGPGFRPEPWRPRDSLAFVLLMARDLSFWNDRPEEERYLWLRELGEERARELVGGDADLSEEIVALARHGGGAAEPSGEGAEAATPGSPGSNNWALGPSRTASGAPLVANDPHLPFRLPGTWYQALLRAPGYQAAGMTLPGLPGVVIGRNRDLAWALTNVMLDDHDLFFEELSDDGRRVRRGEGWREVEVERQRIGVRDEEPVEIELARTDRGPLLPADPERGLPPRSLAWTLYQPSDPLSAFLALGRAASVDDLAGALDGYVGPAQNLVVADRDGGLLWTVLGRVPDRRAGDGRFPAPGWDPAYGWDRLLPREGYPSERSPQSDLLVTANHRVVPAAHPFPLTADYDTPHRAERIRRRVTAGGPWTPAATAALQTDVTDLYALEVVEAALDGLPAELDGPASRARDLLAAWDGRTADATPDGSPLPAAPLFALFEHELRRRVFDDEAEAHGLPPFSSRDRLQRLLAGRMSPAWFDDVTTSNTETRGDVVTAALVAAWEGAAERWGDDPAGWSYGDLHTLTLPHPLGDLPLVGRLFQRGPYPVPGSATTVAAFGATWTDQGHLRVVYGPSMRWVTPLDAPDATLAVLPAGQAGHPRDPHYDDQTAAYLAGDTHPFPWSEAAVEEGTVSRLLLRPTRDAGGGE